MNFIITNTPLDKDKLSSLSQTLVFGTYNNFYWCADSQISLHKKTDSLIAFIQGYLNDFSLDQSKLEAQNESAISKILSEWPANDDVSGSFALTVINKNAIKLYNDPIGFYPLYYSISKDTIIVTSSLIWASTIIKTSFDSIGVAQRSIGKEYANIGSRTILKGVKRLLPGESISINTSSLELTKNYDDSLYSSIENSKASTPSDFIQFWNTYKKEVSYAVAKKPKLNIALSGGMDSRILLGSVSEEKKLKCLTYGDPESYEVKVARKIAKIRSLEFQCYEDLNLYFPKKSTIKTYVKDTESLYVSSWLEILENVPKADDTQFFLGDMCEVLPGRNIKVFSGRDTRIGNFIKTNILNKDFQFTDASDKAFENWKQRKTTEALRRYSKQRFDTLELDITYDELIEGVKYNLEELFNRIKSHQLPLVELYDELYAWYTHSRIPMGKQILICNSKFSSTCPPMSLSILRAASNIHPNNRLNYRFMNGIFKYNKDLKSFGKIPTNQSPIIPHNFYAPIIFLVWGIRSKIDQYFIRRILKKKNPNLRYRLFKGLNWVKVYQNDDIEKRLSSYFSPNHLGGKVSDAICKSIISRKELKKWPLTNTDLMSLVSLNLEIGIIKEYNSKK